MEILGVGVDEQGRCEHWHSERDVVALQFPCCGRFYACRECHDALADHPAAVWPVAEFETQAILCGACGETLTIARYLALDPYACPGCGHEFNPGCRTHRHLYFGS
jgi:uncharacterized CHY-type Zn-finger protein